MNNSRSSPPFRAGYFAFRVPALPTTTLIEWAKGVQSPAATADDLAAALEHDHELLGPRLLQIAHRPEVVAALAVASPDLVEALENRACDAGVQAAVVRYISRMATRPTPFGLFAACGAGDIGDSTVVSIPHPAKWGRRSRLDGDYLDRIIQDRAAKLRPQLKFLPNDSHYFVTGMCRFVQARFVGRERTHHLAQVEDTPLLRRALGLAGKGAMPRDIAEGLVAEEVPPSIASRYVDDLIEAQLLVPELALTLTGPRPGDALITDLAAAGDAETAAALRELDAELATIDHLGSVAPAARYKALAAKLGYLPAPESLSTLMQVDMSVPPTGATLAKSVVDDLVRGIEMLSRIAPALQPDDLDRFREAFTERYEEREVPLLEALDDDAGIGFGATGSSPEPLLKGLPRPARELSVSLGRREQRLLEMLHRAWSAHAEEVVLNADDIGALERPEPAPLPDALSAIASLAQTHDGVRVVLASAGGPSGANLLGRFASADPELAAKVRDHIRQEEALDPDALYAEVVHLPAGRMSNILVRPVLREWELEWLGRSGAPAERRLPVSDLLVSVREGRIILRSSRLGRRIVPRLTSAHNTNRRSPAVYRFLAAVQNDRTTGGVAWSWAPYGAAPFLPRVRWGRLVLAVAEWKVKPKDLGLGEGTGPVERWRAAQTLRVRLRLPRWIRLVEDDNKLAIDLDNALSVDALVRAMRRRDEVRLQELFPAPDQVVAQGPDGPRALELVVPLVRSTTPPASSLQRESRAPITARRAFPPGSEWTYLKLYTGQVTADTILREQVSRLTKELIDSGAADRWFFIRYADPRFHLRLRFRGKASEITGPVQRFSAALLDAGLASEAQLGTYEREIERYGGQEAVDIVERIFHADSDAVIALLGMIEPGAPGQDERWRIGVLGVEALLHDLGLDEDARAAQARRFQAAFEREFGAAAGLRHAVAEKVRAEEASVTGLLAASADGDHPLAPGIAVVGERSRRVAPRAAELVALREAGCLSRSIDDLGGSLAHMWLNRICRTQNRLQEYVTYALLARVLRARLARRRAAGAG